MENRAFNDATTLVDQTTRNMEELTITVTVNHCAGPHEEQTDNSRAPSVRYAPTEMNESSDSTPTIQHASAMMESHLEVMRAITREIQADCVTITAHVKEILAILENRSGHS
jgi:hypothetical protein